jgi:hypothetical protein
VLDDDADDSPNSDKFLSDFLVMGGVVLVFVLRLDDGLSRVGLSFVGIGPGVLTLW